MPNEGRARSKPRGELGQRQPIRNFKASSSQARREDLELPALGFASNQEQSCSWPARELVRERDPILQRPILAFASASGMERNGGGASRFRSYRQARDGIGIEDRQPLQRGEEDLGRVKRLALVGTMRANDELAAATLAHIRLKDFVGIVKIRDNDRESLEVTLQTGVKRRVGREETGQRLAVNRADVIDQPGGERQLRDVRVGQ